MSRGIGAFAKKVLEDENTVMYEYGPYNLNEPEFRNIDHIYDGYITIAKECFVEPEIHEKTKKMPSGKKKLITKRVLSSVDYGKMLLDGKIQVENSRFAWNVTEDSLKIDVMACHLLFKLFNKYQEGSVIPESINYDV